MVNDATAAMATNSLTSDPKTFNSHSGLLCHAKSTRRLGAWLAYSGMKQ